MPQTLSPILISSIATITVLTSVGGCVFNSRFLSIFQEFRAIRSVGSLLSHNEFASFYLFQLPDSLSTWREPTVDAGHITTDELKENDEALWRDISRIFVRRGYTSWKQLELGHLEPEKKTFSKPTGYAMISPSQNLHGRRDNRINGADQALLEFSCLVCTFSRFSDVYSCLSYLPYVECAESSISYAGWPRCCHPHRQDSR